MTFVGGTCIGHGSGAAICLPGANKRARCPVGRATGRTDGTAPCLYHARRYKLEGEGRGVRTNGD